MAPCRWCLKTVKSFFPEIPPPAPGEIITTLEKILVYQEFPSFGPLIRNVRAPLVVLLLDAQFS
jgi:hypothetical protein